MLINSYPRPEKYCGFHNALRSVQEIPNIFQHLFQNFQYFNQFQSKVFDDAFYSDKSIIVSAPTGSGKTVLFELSILRLLMKLEDRNQLQEDFKIIYIAPIKALCNEKFNDWQEKFEKLGLKCNIITGDDYNIDLHDIAAINIIVTTPEKWDSLTRKWRECLDFVRSIKLFMIDEIHLLNEDKRGAILEVIVSRMKTIEIFLNKGLEESAVAKIRYVAVSATIPNIEDLACWLENGPNSVKYYKIADDLRPVKLTTHVIGYDCKYLTPFKFDMSLNYKLPKIIYKFWDGKPVLIFCSTRKGVEMAADVLSTQLMLRLDDHQKYKFSLLARKFSDNKLQLLIVKGIAYHHAGLNYENRLLVEENFRSGDIPVLLSTNTLAMGVNLPAHLVIVKSTDTYNQGTCQPLSESAILQMIGRAGRPQFDVTGTAIILTQQQNIKRYENLINGSMPIESNLYKYLPEHLNAEIVLQTITDSDVVMQWIRSTFLYVRAIKNPSHYNIPIDTDKNRIEKKLEEMCLHEIDELEKYKLIKREQNYGISIMSTIYGCLMARSYLSFDTMKLFSKVRGNESLERTFNILVNCHEFVDHHLRVSDKRILNELNASPGNEIIRFPIRGKIKNVNDKTSCLLQAILGNLTIHDSSLQQESVKMAKLAQRILKCLLDYVRTSANSFESGIFCVTRAIIILIKCFQTNLWENSPYVSKQLKKIGPVYSRELAKNGKTTFDALLETSPREIERILKKSPPFGQEILNAIKQLPQYTLKLDIQTEKRASVEVKQLNENYHFNNDKTNNINAWLIIGDSDNRTLLYNDNVQAILSEYGSYVRTFSIKNKNIKFISGHLIHQNIVGVDKSVKLDYLIGKSTADVSKTSHVNEKTVAASSAINKQAAKKSTNKKQISDYFSTKDGNRKRKIAESSVANTNKTDTKKNLINNINSNNNFLPTNVTSLSSKNHKNTNFDVISTIETDNGTYFRTDSKKNSVDLKNKEKIIKLANLDKPTLYNRKLSIFEYIPPKDIQYKSNEVIGRAKDDEFMVPDSLSNKRIKKSNYVNIDKLIEPDVLFNKNSSNIYELMEPDLLSNNKNKKSIFEIPCKEKPKKLNSSDIYEIMEPDVLSNKITKQSIVEIPCKEKSVSYNAMVQFNGNLDFDPIDMDIMKCNKSFIESKATYKYCAKAPSPSPKALVCPISNFKNPKELESISFNNNKCETIVSNKSLKTPIDIGIFELMHFIDDDLTSEIRPSINSDVHNHSSENHIHPSTEISQLTQKFSSVKNLSNILDYVRGPPSSGESSNVKVINLFENRNVDEIIKSDESLIIEPDNFEQIDNFYDDFLN